MPTTPLFPLPEGLEISSMSETAEEVLVRVTSHRQTSKCPCCSTPSSAIHSYYRRKPLDLPCAGRPIRLLLTVKKFFCRVPDCPRKIFVERLPDLIAVSSRLTMRLRSAVQEISLATCGKGGERLAGKLGIPLCDATLLWSLAEASAPLLSRPWHAGGQMISRAVLALLVLPGLILHVHVIQHRCEILVAQQLLERKWIIAQDEASHRKGVPEDVGADALIRDPCSQPHPLHQQTDPIFRHWSSVFIGSVSCVFIDTACR